MKKSFLNCIYTPMLKGKKSSLCLSNVVKYICIEKETSTDATVWSHPTSIATTSAVSGFT